MCLIYTCDKLKAAILREYHLTPNNYRKEYASATKDKEESYVQFNTRLQVLLKYYLESREVGNDFTKMFNLLIRDRLFQMLPPAIKDHVLVKEEESWFEPNLLARIADIYANDHPNIASRGFERTDRVQNRNQTSHSGKPTGDRARSDLLCGTLLVHLEVFNH